MSTRSSFSASFIFCALACSPMTNDPYWPGGDEMDDGDTGAMDDASVDAAGTSEASSGAGAEESGGDPDPEGDGLPCDIDSFLAERCRTCHSDAPAIAPSPLLTRADLLADSLTQPGTSVGAVAASRLQDLEQPMPPPPASTVPIDEADAFRAWVESGMPIGDCQGEEPSPFDVEPTCTSATFWTEGLFEGDEHMNPGRTCISCHTDPTAFGQGAREEEEEEEEDAPRFLIAGTLFPTAHEPDDCFGVDGTDAATDVRIEVTRDGGPTLTLPVNAAGNFYLEEESAPAGFAPPYLVKVLADGVELPMIGAVEHGDCNACHTQDGTDDAPGRIILP